MKMENITTRDPLSPEHERELAAARDFYRRYGREFIEQANEICRGVAFEMMRLYQIYKHPGSCWPRGLMRSLSEANLTFREWKIRHFKRLFRALNALCKKTKLPRLSPRDFIKGSQLGPDPSEDQMEQFWDELWNQLPSSWQSTDFQWSRMEFSDMELPFFVWIVRPPTARLRRTL